jgi:hypothetical protein
MSAGFAGMPEPSSQDLLKAETFLKTFPTAQWVTKSAMGGQEPEWLPSRASRVGIGRLPGLPLYLPAGRFVYCAGKPGLSSCGPECRSNAAGLNGTLLNETNVRNEKRGPNRFGAADNGEKRA